METKPSRGEPEQRKAARRDENKAGWSSETELKASGGAVGWSI